MMKELADKLVSDQGPIARIFRFGLVGGLATGTYFVSGLAFTWGGLSIELSHVLAFAVSIVVSFVGHKVFTFQEKGGVVRSGTRFAIATGFIALSQFALVHLLHRFGLGVTPTLLASSIYYPVMSLVIHNYWTFRATTAEAAEP